MSLAKCSVCSRYDRNINVICERRCLICARCQGNPVIKKLFSDNADRALCPLCDSVMSRTMVSWCQANDTNNTNANANPVDKNTTVNSSIPNIHSMGMSRCTNDLDTMSNPLPYFLKKP